MKSYFHIALFCTFLTVLVGPARADIQSSGEWFASLSDAQRLAVQANLVLLGDYTGLVDRAFGPGTYAALAKFQTTHSAVGDGVLTDKQMTDLNDAARSILNKLDIRNEDDVSAGLKIYIPHALFIDRKSDRDGNVYTSEDGQIILQTFGIPHTGKSFQQAFLDLTHTNRAITYSALGSTSFVITGMDNGVFFYDRFYDDGSSAVGFQLVWTRRYRSLGSMLSIFMASFSFPLNDDSLTVPKPEGRPPTKGDGPELASGSGFFFNSSGMIATNFHVAGECSRLTVPGYGDAHLVKGDRDHDLAVIQLSSGAYPSVTPAIVRSTPVALAESVVLLGYPLADVLNSSLNVSTGIVSSETGANGNAEWFTTNAGVEPGNSGGPLLDQQGHVIGVAVAKIDEMKLLAEAGTSGANVGFGIGASTLLSFLAAFPHSTADDDESASPKTPQAISAMGKAFTVQVLCEVGGPAAAPKVATKTTKKVERSAD